MAESGEMQLDRAEFEESQPVAACAMCTAALQGEYYEANGEMVCAGCQSQLQSASANRGTRSSRVLRALGAGGAAALGGAILYWAILAATGYEFGLIAVVVGFGVGKAVHWGSRGKGGWRYQTMAMVLTYLAMVSAYVPLLINELTKEPVAVEQTADPQLATAASPSPASSDVPVEPSLGQALYSIGLLVAFICALPFLSGIQNILGIFILGFGLYEAWKLNRRVELVITGPHVLATVEAT